jgi:hypothetical protein
MDFLKFSLQIPKILKSPRPLRNQNFNKLQCMLELEGNSDLRDYELLYKDRTEIENKYPVDQWNVANLEYTSTEFKEIAQLNASNYSPQHVKQLEQKYSELQIALLKIQKVKFFILYSNRIWLKVKRRKNSLKENLIV